MSDVYRYLLNTREKELIELNTEIEFIKAYLFLLKVRFEENIKIEITIPENILHLLLPPVSLQLLIENAIKHNVASRHSPLHIQIFCMEKFVVVKNRLKPKLQKEESTGVGLNNIRKRYEILAKENIQIIESKEFFEVRLPLLKINKL